jgi:transcriptional regulator with XRE-family HTH domain
MAPQIGRSRLPELLATKGWSQAEFARRLGISEGFLSQVISGKRYFSYPTASEAAWLLGCSMEDLHERII